MRRVEVSLDEQEFAHAAIRAQEAGVSLETWVRHVIRQAATPARPNDPLFGLLAQEPDLADALDAVVDDRSTRSLRS